MLEEDRKRRKTQPRDPSSALLMQEDFTPNCPVHGLMHLPGYVKLVVDTPHFQRMRHIKQLGVCSLVFPGAKHDRFFHSIGTAHLAYNLMKDLRSLQPELCILDRDIVCVVLAALMHDLGHPTYSHMFETFMASIGHATWTHEQASIVLVKEVLKTINLSLITADEEGDDLEFICELIDPPKDELNKCLNNDSLKEKWPTLMKGRPVEKAYMYEIVSNFRSGIDVDKMDYFRRDAYFLGIKREFDHHRYLKSLRVIQDNQGISTLSPPEKSKDDIRENLCELRKTLHRTAYQHKTVKKFEAHMVDILKLCDKTIRVSGRNGKKMSISEAALSGDTVAYSKLTDMFIESRLLENEDPELQEACAAYDKHFLQRNLMRNVLIWEVPSEQEEPGFSMPQVDKFVEETLRLSTRQVPKSELRCVESKLHYGMGSEDPIKKIVFHDKQGQPRTFDVDYDANPLRRKLFLFWNPSSIEANHLDTLERLTEAATKHVCSIIGTDPVSTTLDCKLVMGVWQADPQSLRQVCLWNSRLRSGNTMPDTAACTFTHIDNPAQASIAGEAASVKPAWGPS
ncbi:samhd1 [Symbiodinium natans]|uniref:Samhd1 protein n=1 Tax=Symbiodinium natans TaxID=878477 RepID=A0A812V4L6_9DINO|nr:samhd1 [Symbiodinium natans]